MRSENKTLISENFCEKNVLSVPGSTIITVEDITVYKTAKISTCIINSNGKKISSKYYSDEIKNSHCILIFLFLKDILPAVKGNIIIKVENKTFHRIVSNDGLSLITKNTKNGNDILEVTKIIKEDPKIKICPF